MKDKLLIVLAALDVINPLGAKDSELESTYRPLALKFLDFLEKHGETSSLSLDMCRQALRVIFADRRISAECAYRLVQLLCYAFAHPEQLETSKGAELPLMGTVYRRYRGTRGNSTREVLCPDCGTKKRVDGTTKRFRCPCGFDQPIELVPAARSA